MTVHVPDLIARALDPEWEPGFDQYRAHLAAINRIMMDSGVPMEGSLFTPNRRPVLPELPAPAFRAKRRNFALFCTTGSSLLEIGFNGGHSCMLALTINPDLRYTGVDIGLHAYTPPCYDYLRDVFGERLTLHIGDSRDVLPALLREPQRYDLFHIDGGHGLDAAVSDLNNVIAFDCGGAGLLVDDTPVPEIDAVCELEVLRGRITPIIQSRIWSETPLHRMFRITGKQ
jgi:methyltransferase family protein